MKAFILKGVHNLKIIKEPLELVEIPIPVPSASEILIKVSCCGISHTDLDEIEGRIPSTSSFVVPGHQVIGIVEAIGINVNRFKKGDRVGVARMFSVCEKCDYCINGFENLCSEYKATGRDANGGYAEYMTVSEKFTYLIPDGITDSDAAPLLSSGSIGYRSLCISGIKNGQTLGLIGFGATGHLLLKIARQMFPDTNVFVFARHSHERNFALSLGAYWVGEISGIAPEKLNYVIDTTPVWKPIIESLRHLKPGGSLLVNSVRKEEGDKVTLLDLNFHNHLGMEKSVKSIANVTRKDTEDFLALVNVIQIKPEVEAYPFTSLNNALLDLKHKQIKGAKVLCFDSL